MPDKIDFKKQYPDLYLPKRTPTLIDVPAMPFLMIDGAGAPQDEDYQQALSALYTLTFTIKMSKLQKTQPGASGFAAGIPGYQDYVAPPLEGLWWCEDADGRPAALDFQRPKSDWRWTSMIRTPDFVTPEAFAWAAEQARRKKPKLPVERVRFEIFTEGLCVQRMHIGPYAEETASIAELLRFIEQNGLAHESGFARRHHEIYLGDPRRTAPERLKTVLRLPVARKAGQS